MNFSIRVPEYISPTKVQFLCILIGAGDLIDVGTAVGQALLITEKDLPEDGKYIKTDTANKLSHNPKKRSSNLIYFL